MSGNTNHRDWDGVLTAGIWLESVGSVAAPDLIRPNNTLPDKVLAQIRHALTPCLNYNRASPLSMTDLVEHKVGL